MEAAVFYIFRMQLGLCNKTSKYNVMCVREHVCRCMYVCVKLEVNIRHLFQQLSRVY